MKRNVYHELNEEVSNGLLSLYREVSKIANELRFLMAEKEREKITIQQLKKIRKVYEGASKDFAHNYKALKGRENISSILRMQYIDDMQKNLSKEIARATKEIEAGIEGAILQTSQAVIADNQSLLNKMGFGFKKAYSFVPDDVVKTIVSGQLYQSDWTLSKAIWGDSKKTLTDIDTIIAKGITMNKGSFDIAKDLEKYVDPSAAKDWEWSKVYPNTKKRIDYNAQRLARTMVSHAYQESFQRATTKNPFVENYKWETSNSHTTCDLCIDRATQDKYGLGAGIYPKDALPLDHPNGKCIVVLNMEGSMSDVADQIAEWYKAPSGTYPDIDAFADSLDGLDTKRKIDAVKRVTQATKKTIPRAKKYIEQPFEYEEVPSYVQGVGEKAYDDTVRALARKNKISYEVAQQKLDDTFASLVDNSDFGMHVNSDNLLKALDDGYFKNQHETGMSGGYFGPKMRLKEENALFNVPKENGVGMSNADRPVYGMLVPKYNNSELTKNYYTNGPGSWYGDGVTVVFKRESVINQSTLTIGDSFDYSSRVKATLASNPKCVGSFDYKKVNSMLMEADIKDANSAAESFANLVSSGKKGKRNTYVEVQLHGKQSHSIENIQTVFLDKSKSSQYTSLINKLKKEKIPYEWIG